jgi:SAM-dependent methyltransferase
MEAMGDPFHQYSDRERYDTALAEALSVSGESKEHFARGRVQTTAEILARLGAPADSVLDFGCGIGDTTPLLIELLGAKRVVGVDPSVQTIEYGRAQGRGPGIELVTSDELAARGERAAFDVCYTNGVFHHIPIDQRVDALATVRDALRPGGRMFLWENHAGNPGTRFVMARCAFDEDAIPVWPHQARRMLKQAGFVVETTRYRFLFPRSLRFMRPLERFLLKLPIGAQYVVVARRPASGD